MMLLHCHQTTDYDVILRACVPDVVLIDVILNDILVSTDGGTVDVVVVVFDEIGVVVLGGIDEICVVVGGIDEISVVGIIIDVVIGIIICVVVEISVI